MNREPMPIYSDHLVLQGKDGVKWLAQWGSYAVIVNGTLYELGRAGKYAVVNVHECWVDSVHHSRAEAVNEARHLSAL